MPRFLITFNHVEGAWQHLAPRDRDRVTRQLRDFQKDLAREQHTHLVFLHAAEHARTVRMHPDGRVDVSEGPYREDAEYPGGFYIVEAASLDEAVEWAKRGRFLVGSNEVREIHETPA